MLEGSGSPKNMTFDALRCALVKLAGEGTTPINLVLEAPLSVAFAASGNPVGRAVERRERQTRYWYVGLGCAVLVAATYLLRALHDAPRTREIRLFEGLVSFKDEERPTSHCNDALALRAVIWEPHVASGRVVAPNALLFNMSDTIVSAFAVAGMDFGIPPVLLITPAH